MSDIPKATIANAHTPIAGDSKAWVYGCGDGLCPTSRQCVAAGKCLKDRPRILTEFVNPPIPERSNDWAAYREGEQEDDRITGRGPNEAIAVADLIEQTEERDGR